MISRGTLNMLCANKIDVCVCLCLDVEVDVDEINQEQVMDLNKMATPYGMAEGDFVRYILIYLSPISLTSQIKRAGAYMEF